LTNKDSKCNNIWDIPVQPNKEGNDRSIVEKKTDQSSLKLVKHIINLSKTVNKFKGN